MQSAAHPLLVVVAREELAVVSREILVVGEGIHPHKKVSRTKVLPDCLIRAIARRLQEELPGVAKILFPPCEAECQIAHLLETQQVDLGILDSADSDVAVYQTKGFVFHYGTWLSWEGESGCIPLIPFPLHADVTGNSLNGRLLDVVVDDRRVLACIVAGCDYYSRSTLLPHLLGLGKMRFSNRE